MNAREPFDDPDDYFRETRMSFADHIEELRVHLLRAVYGFCLALIIAFPIGWYVMEWIKAPVVSQLDEFYDRRVRDAKTKLDNDDPEFKNLNELKAARRLFAVAELAQLGVKVPDNSPLLTEDRQRVELTTWERPLELAIEYHPAMTKIGRKPGLSTLSVQEAFFVYVKVSLITGFVLASPWIFIQIWNFVAAGLYPHEKKLVNVYVPFSIVLFIIGVVVCQLLVMPQAVSALLWFNEWLGLEPDMRLNEWLGFAIMMPVLFGLSFQTPLIMLFLGRIGICTVKTYRDYRKIALFLLMVVCAVVTPSSDPWSLLFMWVPIALFYELGIVLCIMNPGPPLLDFGGEGESEEMVEV